MDSPTRSSEAGAPSIDVLAGLAAFATVMERGSFTSAAKALGISKSEVSKRVAALETRLGVRLLLRSTRKLAPTEAGLAVQERAARMLDEADAARTVAQGYHADVQGTLRVNGPMLFGESHLSPLVPVFLAKYPDVRLELSLTDAFIDPVAERMDITVRIARLADTTMLARKICDDRRMLVAAPSMFEGRPLIQHPREILDLPVIRFSRLAARDEWRFRDPEGGREFSLEPSGRLLTDSGVAMRAAAEAGIGLAVLPEFIVGESVAAGRLLQLLPDWALTGHGIYALYHPGRQVSPAVRAFLTLLSDRVGRRAV